MTGSCPALTPDTPPWTAERFYAGLAAALAPPQLAALAAPLAQAAAAFTFAETTFSTPALHAVVTDLVAALGAATGAPRPPSQAQALALLDRCYRGPHGAGYAAALLDAASDPADGIAVVLSRLVAGLQDHHRAQYVQSVIATRLAALDPEQQHAVADLVVTRLSGADADDQAAPAVNWLLTDLPAALAGCLTAPQPGTQVLGRPRFAGDPPAGAARRIPATP